MSYFPEPPRGCLPALALLVILLGYTVGRGCEAGCGYLWRHVHVEVRP